MKRILIFLTLLSILILTACAPALTATATSMPSEIPAPSATSTPSETPTTQPSSTPEETSTPEKSYTSSSVVTLADISSGDYQKWLDKQPACNSPITNLVPANVSLDAEYTPSQKETSLIPMDARSSYTFGYYQTANTRFCAEGLINPSEWRLANPDGTPMDNLHLITYIWEDTMGRTVEIKGAVGENEYQHMLKMGYFKPDSNQRLLPTDILSTADSSFLVSGDITTHKSGDPRTIVKEFYKNQEIDGINSSADVKNLILNIKKEGFTDDNKKLIRKLVFLVIPDDAPSIALN